MNSVKLALIGCGPHARRIYLPALRALCSRHRIELELVVELASERGAVAAALAGTGFAPETVLLEPFSGALPEQLGRQLAEIAARKGIQGVIIATEPLVHKAYAEWAMECGLHILIDKPVTARADAVSSLASADGILEDFDDLLRMHLRRQQHGEKVFMVNAQRRVHAGFLFAEKLLAEVGRQTNCPVTSLQSYHCDGQWRLPGEIVTQTYHPYCQGYGKASHSGYHIFDMMYRLFMASGVSAKRPDAMEVVSSFVQPAGFIKQLTEADYQALFGPEYDSTRRWSDQELQALYPDYGEIDVSGVVTLKHQDVAIANLSVNLLHNGYAQRTWLMPGDDLYKGNGRVKHEQHNIQQGPFQNIQIHSYQASDKHHDTGAEQHETGGNNHFDVHVYRNPMVAAGRPALQIYKWADVLAEMAQSHSTLLASEAAKHEITAQFVSYLAGATPKAALPSQIEDHRTPVQIMSALYRSHVLRQRGIDCVVRMPFGAAPLPLSGGMSQSGRHECAQ
jgi:predicted dehydrogenase